MCLRRSRGATMTLRTERDLTTVRVSGCEIPKFEFTLAAITRTCADRCERKADRTDRHRALRNLPLQRCIAAGGSVATRDLEVGTSTGW
jgi:hypothetical protein